MFSTRRRHPRPKWPITRQTGVLWMVVGGILLSVVIGTCVMVLISAWPVVVTLGLTMDATTTGVILVLLFMMVGMVTMPLVLLLALSAFILGWGIYIFSCDAQLRQRGVLVQGVVEDRWYTAGYRSRWHCLAYRFAMPLPDGHHRAVTRAERNPAAYWRFDIGDPILVCYLPEKPEICRIELERR